jgi:chemotaxis protein methyltransferase CheR
MTGAESFRGLHSDAGGRVPGSAVGSTALHETGFFRDRDVFDALRESALPRLIEANGATRRLRVWCAACSTGQEAYSVAMLLREHFAEQVAGWDVRIVATDIADDAVEYARRGRYRRAEVNRGLAARLLVKYFVRDGEEWVVVPELRAMCEFREADVCHPNADTERFDLVLMRNVLLFLPEPDRAAAFELANRRMARHGVLVLGQAEQAEDSTELFEAEYLAGCCFYRKAMKS